MESEALRSRVEAQLRTQEPGLTLRSLRPLGGGACQDLFLLETGAGERLVLRSDAAQALPGSLDRAREFVVAEAAAEAGVSTPPPRWLSADLLREGASAYLMPHVPGESLGGRVTRSPELAAARGALPRQWAEELAALARVEPSPALREALGEPPADPAQARVAELRAMVARLPDPRPALELALAWLEAKRPPPPERVGLVHGDFRVGNFLVGPEGLLALLDWEFAHWGDPVEDLAWLCVRDWRFGQDALAAGGVATREALLAAWRAAGLAEVEPERLAFWEVYGATRWAAGARFQAERYRSGERRDLELLAIGWRALELEFEALRQIERGGPPLPSLGEPTARPPRGAPPSAQELLLGVADLLSELRGELERGPAFRARIGASLLQSLAHESARSEALEREERALLAPLVGLEAAPCELERELCRRAQASPSAEDQRAWRRGVLAQLALRISLRNPRFDLRLDLP